MSHPGGFVNSAPMETLFFDVSAKLSIQFSCFRGLIKNPRIYSDLLGIGE